MHTSNNDLGAVGENLVAARYFRQGYQVLERNVRYPFGEIDLVVEDPDGTTVFVEVKTRRGEGFGVAESVTPRKLSRMRHVAAAWLKGKPYRDIRFDVVTVRVEPHTGHFVVDCFEGVTHGAR
ncbi:hypothetical protein CFAEC_08760 [Corynebacterium faecale]|uniref:YraN family protein n=1 Tax=Corynebacterium faecale TaxID=1758466 RepID=UPI0025B32C5A|nr:YraN family protein [Corynebacterium faecale]WJY92569.1 hypothetical protein CFAEC_08760 [Corynebacterium faecale]